MNRISDLIEKVNFMKKIIFLVLICFFSHNYGQEESKHSPAKALILSAIIPGAGQIYNKKAIKGIGVACIEISLFSTAVYFNQQYQKNHLSSNKDKTSLCLLGGTLTFFYSIFDAYIDAHFFEYDRWSVKPSLNRETIGLMVNYNF